MATPNLGITELTPAQTDKTTTINQALTDLDEATQGYLAHTDIVSFTVTTEEFRSAFNHDLTGSTAGAITVTMPSGNARFFSVTNATGNTVTIEIGAAGSNKTLGNADTGLYFTDGTAIELLGLTSAAAAFNAYEMIVAVGDETTTITTGTAKVTFRMPVAVDVTKVKASLTTASSSGLPTVDINVNGTSLLTTKLTIDANEKTSETAATAAVIDTTQDNWSADDEITIDIDVAGTGAKGLKVTIIGTRP
jgi:hypothetical protein